MKIKFLVAAAVAITVQLFNISDAIAIDDVTICGNCSSQASFENAAVNQVGGRAGEHMILVVNSNTKVSRWLVSSMSQLGRLSAA